MDTFEYLIACLCDGRDDLFQAAIQQGVNLSGLEDGNSLTVFASPEGPDILRKVLEAGADPNVRCTGDGFTALLGTMFEKEPEDRLAKVRMLLEHGANSDASIEEGGDSPLHVATHFGYLDVIQLLVEHGGYEKSLASYDECSRMPLHWACLNGHYEAAKYLISLGADINANEEEQIGETPLGDCADSCTASMARLLLEAGADPTISGWMQLTAYDLAASRTDPEGEAVKTLMEAFINRRRS